MLIFECVLTGTEVCSDSYPSEQFAGGAVVGMESKRVTDSGVVLNIGANASAEAEEEALDDGEETFINIVKSHMLQSVPLDKKEFKTYMKSYWKTLLKKLQKNILLMADLNPDEMSDDKKEAAAELEAAIAALSKYDVKAVEDAQAQLAAFKANFAALQDWVKKDVVKNFDEFEFYIPENAMLGECLIIPARYIGEAETPTFLIIMAGVIGKKE